jgi:hypothetical protein
VMMHDNMLYEVGDIKKQLNVLHVCGSFFFRSCILLYFISFWNKTLFSTK